MFSITIPAPNRVPDLTSYNAVEIATSSAVLGWTIGESSADSFEVIRWTSDTLPTLLTVLDGSARRFADNTLNPSTTYYYRIKAINAYGNSYSETIVVQTLSRTTTAQYPIIIAASGGAGYNFGSWETRRSSSLSTWVSRIMYVGIMSLCPQCTLTRGFAVFDTRGIASTESIISAKVVLALAPGNGPNMNSGDNYSYFALASTTPWIPTGLTTSQYGGVDLLSTSILSEKYTPEQLTGIGSYIPFQLNAEGLRSVIPQGYTYFSLREGHDIENIEQAANQFDEWYVDTSPNSYLEITYER